MNEIEIHNITFSYDNETIFSNLSLSVTKGSIVSLIGNSGCGKSTLLNLITGILKPMCGKIIINSDFSYLMQEPVLLSYKTALENALFPCELKGKKNKNTVSLAKDLLKTFKIEENSLLKFPHELSGGMKQRIGIIQALLTNTPLLLFDEPFNAIDVNTIYTIGEYIWKYIKKEGKTLIFITHDFEQAINLSDNIIILNNVHSSQEIRFPTSFCKLPPNQRKNAIDHNKIWFEIISAMNHEV